MFVFVDNIGDIEMKMHYAFLYMIEEVDRNDLEVNSKFFVNSAK